jgi:hypothetical protein
MIQTETKHGNQIFSDGTYSRKTIYTCESVEEFITLLDKIQKENKSYEAKISEKEITVTEWVDFMGHSGTKTTMQKIIAKTQLVFDDGITEEMWEAVEKLIDEIHEKGEEE